MPLEILPDFPITIDEVAISTRVAVLENLKYDIILGTDFFKATGAQISFGPEDPHMSINYQGRTRTLYAECSQQPFSQSVFEKEFE